jgi:hypothetical protein
MLTITGKALGRKRPLFADWSIPLDPEMHGEGMVLRDVISRIVRAEVTAFKDRQTERQFLRALTAREIQTGADKGKIEMGASEVPVQPVDEDSAVAVALQAFEDGLYLVVIDEQEQRNLDSPVYLQSDSRITFIRLTMLAGG